MNQVFTSLKDTLKEMGCEVLLLVHDLFVFAGSLTFSQLFFCKYLE